MWYLAGNPEMKKLLFAIVIALLIDCAVWLVQAHHLLVTGLNPFVGSVVFLLSIPVLMVGILIAFRVGRRLRWRWGYGAMSPWELFVMGAICFFFYEAVEGKSTLDFMVHDTIFVISARYVQFATSLFFALVAAVYYFFPRITGRQLQRTLGFVHFGGSFVGVSLLLLTGVPMPMPRRYIDIDYRMYYAGIEWWAWCLTGCALLLVLAQVVFLLNLIYSSFRGKKIL